MSSSARKSELPAIALQLDVFVPPELERLAVLAVGGPETVLVVVGLVIHRAREQRPIVTLLQLYRVAPALLGDAEQLAAPLDAALMVVAHLGDDEAIAFVADDPAVDRQGTSHK